MRTYQVRDKVRFCIGRESFVGKIIEIGTTHEGPPRYLVMYGEDSDSLGSIWITEKHMAEAAMKHPATAAEQQALVAGIAELAEKTLGVYDK